MHTTWSTMLNTPKQCLNSLMHIPSATQGHEEILFQIVYLDCCRGVLFSCFWSWFIYFLLLCKALLKGSRSRRDLHRSAGP